MIQRNKYLEQLIAKKDNGKVKIITGIRRSGKSFLLFEIYYGYLKGLGIEDDQIITLSLDEIANIKYRNPFLLDEYIRTGLKDKNRRYYVFIDEIQKVVPCRNPYVEGEYIGFVDVVLGLMKLKNVDIYVTGSNSTMLSSDIITSFRDRGDEIRVYPLSYSEFSSAYEGEEKYRWSEYYTYGGMPYVLSLKTHEEKSKYLKDLYEKTYLDDILERHQVKNDKEILEDLMNIISSSIGSLSNPTRLANTFKSLKKVTIGSNTISTYLDYFIDAFLLYKAYRYDIKGRKYIDSPLKYYFSDLGLRNARLGFRQLEENHIMENIIYNELRFRGFDVDVGVVSYNYKGDDNRSRKTLLEVDFVANKAGSRYYLQSALSIENKQKREQEINSLCRIQDFFKKIVIVKDPIIPWKDEMGIEYIGIERFLLEEHILLL